MSKADEIRARLEILDAQSLVLTIELRNKLLQVAHDLLPTAVAQAQPQKAAPGHPAKAGSPALLRLITRLAMRNIDLHRHVQR